MVHSFSCKAATCVNCEGRCEFARLRRDGASSRVGGNQLALWSCGSCVDSAFKC